MVTGRSRAPGSDVVAQYLSDTGLLSRVQGVVPLSGDASDRRYVRVTLEGGAPQVLAVYPRPVAFEREPFVAVARLLEAMPVPVPRILGYSSGLGVMALEDLGDTTLLAHLAAATPAERLARYREAVAIIGVLQRRGAELADPEYPPYGLAFDVEKLTWELRFFTTHFLEAHRGAVLPRAARAALEAEWLAIAADLAAEPRVLCHRDYHSRNLMLHGGALHVIDFQDARMGPDTYDLVSLLRDSYVELAGAEVDLLIGEFLACRGLPAAPADRDAFRRRFDLMAVQRNLKALGTFGFQATSRHNPSYLESVPRTLGYLHATLRGNPRFARLQALLAEHLPELR